MSVTHLPAATDDAPPVHAVWTRARRVPWGRVVLVCAALVGSGAVRTWQDARVQRSLRAGMESPLRLDELPLEFGEWKGQPKTLDENIVRGAGADQAVTRLYVNQRTGVAVDVIMLFGPAVEMFIHEPDLCYPKAGYTKVAGSETMPVALSRPSDPGGTAPPAETAPFAWMVYSKGDKKTSLDLQEVVFAWRYNGRWSPDIGTRKHFERVSGMYKVHVARRITPTELAGQLTPNRGTAADPCRALLDQIVPEIEARLKSPRSPGT